MPETGGLGQIVALLRKTDGRNTRLGRAFVLLGTLAFLGGGVILTVAETFPLTAAEWWAYRVAAGTLLGAALPALLHGLVLLADTAQLTKDTSDIGIVVCVLAAGILLSTGAEAPVNLYPALVIYALGVLACVSAVSEALSGGEERPIATPDHRIDMSDDEFVTSNGSGTSDDKIVASNGSGTSDDEIVTSSGSGTSDDEMTL